MVFSGARYGGVSVGWCTGGSEADTVEESSSAILGSLEPASLVLIAGSLGMACDMIICTG